MAKRPLRDRQHSRDYYFTVNVEVFEVAPAVAVMVTVWLVATLLVDTVKVAVVLPWTTVTVVGTDATKMLLLFSATTCPPLCAGPESVTVPVAVVPPVTDPGDTATLNS